jgi:hypothetical protein
VIESIPGGSWADGLSTPRGVVEAERGHVYVDYDNAYGDFVERYMDEQRREELLNEFGGAPKLALHIHASTFDVGSDELAKEVAGLLLGLWGGDTE